MRAKIIDYDDKSTGSTETHMAADELIRKRNALQDKHGNPDDDVGLENAYAEGFAAASGVRGTTAETGGRIRHPETGDKARPNATPESVDRENAGLADN